MPFALYSVKKDGLKKSALILFLLFLPLSISAQSAKNEVRAPQARVQAEFGIDSLERKYYKPDFRFDWLLSKNKASRVFAELRYYERINSRLKGAIDFWANFGAETQLRGRLKIEARLNHFCRHLTSQQNLNILDLNEVLGRLWLEEESYRLGVGLGGYLGKDKTYRNLFIFNLEISHFLAPEVSFESEFKWVNFDEILHEVGFSLALNRSTDLFVHNAKHYQFKNTTYIGIRFKSEAENEKYLDNFMLITGIYPFDDHYKLMVQGAYKLEFFKTPERRFFFDLDFSSPVLSGRDFFAQFWPDKMVYCVRGEYEKKISDELFIAAYAKYNVDMPVDKKLLFGSNLGIGLGVRNQPDFDRLEKKVRYEISAGYNFKWDYDFEIKLGMNTKKKNLVDVGWNFLYRTNREKYLVDFRIFADLGRTICIRPFVGIKKDKYLSGLELSAKSRFITGIGLYKWF